ncbi:MAG: 3-isopropylmalate dehydratase small subunit [Clostridiales bacterium]|nr:3-isopropylmalate dehydratase small subunit [Clostridiales bacterium]
MIMRGNVIKYRDNVDTDVSITARYVNRSSAKDLAAHCMEDLDATFVSRVKKGDIMAAGSNFGCGSSREHAPLAIKESGVGAVVAKSFARIFYRNAINIGLPIIECDADISEGDQVEIDFDKGELKNITKNTVTAFAPFPTFLQNIISAGGLMNSIEGACS